MGGQLYVATMGASLSRRVIGWAIADHHMRTDLVDDTQPRMAIVLRGELPAKVVFSRGQRNSNASDESFFATLKTAFY